MHVQFFQPRFLLCFVHLGIHLRDWRRTARSRKWNRIFRPHVHSLGRQLGCRLFWGWSSIWFDPKNLWDGGSWHRNWGSYIFKGPFKFLRQIAKLLGIWEQSLAKSGRFCWFFIGRSHSWGICILRVLAVTTTGCCWLPLLGGDRRMHGYNCMDWNVHAFQYIMMSKYEGKRIEKYCACSMAAFRTPYSIYVYWIGSSSSSSYHFDFFIRQLNPCKPSQAGLDVKTKCLDKVLDDGILQVGMCQIRRPAGGTQGGWLYYIIYLYNIMIMITIFFKGWIYL